MTTKDEALKMALEALEFSSSYLNELSDVLKFSKKAKPGSTAWHVARAIAACREALAQKDEHEPVAEITADDMGRPFNAIRIGAHFYKEIPPVGTKLYTAPPKRQPLTDEQRYALIEKHLGLERRKNATVIDHRTGRWTDAARYFDLMDAAIVTADRVLNMDMRKYK